MVGQAKSQSTNSRKSPTTEIGPKPLSRLRQLSGGQRPISRFGP
jgi:hypothetical protein